jgi:hypothetical protein
MAKLVCLSLAAAPGYISSRGFYPPSTSSNHRTSFAHSFPHCSLFTFFLSEASNSRQVSWPWLRSPRLQGPRSSLSLKRPPHLHYQGATRFFYLISFTHLLLTLDSSGIVLTFAIDYDPLLYEAPSKFILFSPPSITQFLRPSTLHTTLHTTVDSSHTRRHMNSIDHRIVRLRRHRDRCLRFLTNRYPTLEVATRSKWYQQYRAAEVRIDCLQRQA